MQETHLLDLHRIEKSLQTKRIGRALGYKNELWETIESTNTRAADLAALGFNEGVLVLAGHQTAGRGRLGRKWISPPHSGIYFSVLLRPAVPLSELSVITLACGVAVSTAVEKVAGVRLGLKWVNDLVVAGRKAGGILAEMPSAWGADKQNEGRTLHPALIVGIGLNIRLQEADIPEELADKVEWLERLSGTSIDANVLVCEMARELEVALDALLARETEDILRQWKERSVTLGQHIIATSGNKSLEGEAVDITDSGALIVHSADGARHELHAGEVMIRGKDGSYS